MPVNALPTALGSHLTAKSSNPGMIESSGSTRKIQPSAPMIAPTWLRRSAPSPMPIAA